MRPTLLRNSAVAAASARMAARPAVPRAALYRSAARPMAARKSVQQTQTMQLMRTYANGAGSGGAGDAMAGQGIVLGALALIAVGGYFYLKPLRNAAAKINSALESGEQMLQKAQDTAKLATEKAKDTAGQAATAAKDAAVDIASGDSSAADSIQSVAEALLPGGAFVIYQRLSNMAQGGDWSGILPSLDQDDINSTLDNLKKLGNKDVNKVVEKVQAALDKANGNVQNVDWKGLAQDLGKQLPDQYQQWVKTLVGQVPSMDDFNSYVEDARKIGKQKLKELDEAANTIVKEIEKAQKDGKDVTDGFVEGVKKATPEDYEKFVSKLKQTAKDAGLPADYIEKYLRASAKDAEAWAKDVEKKIGMAARWIPVDSDDVVKQISSVSPNLAKIVDAAIKDAKQAADKGKDALKDGKKQAEKAVDKSADKVKEGADKAKKAVN